MAFARYGFAAVALLVSFAGLSVVTPDRGVAITSWLVGCALIAVSISLVSRALLPGLTTALAEEGSSTPLAETFAAEGSSAPIRIRRRGPDPACMPMLALSPLVFLLGMLVIRSAALLH